MPDWWSAAEMVVILISTEELWSSLTKSFLPQLLSLAGRPGLGRVLLVQNFFHLRMMEATVFLGPSMLQKCFGTLPQVCV